MYNAPSGAVGLWVLESQPHNSAATDGPLFIHPLYFSIFLFSVVFTRSHMLLFFKVCNLSLISGMDRDFTCCAFGSMVVFHGSRRAFPELRPNTKLDLLKFKPYQDLGLLHLLKVYKSCSFHLSLVYFILY